MSERLAANLKSARKAAGIDQAALAARATELGAPLRHNSVSRMERGTRVPSAIEVLALAAALGVTPNRLLISDTAFQDREIALTPSVQQTELRAWLWADGSAPLYTTDDAEDAPAGAARVDDPAAFRRTNRPQDTLDEASYRELFEKRDELHEVRELVRRLGESGALSWGALSTYVRGELVREIATRERIEFDRQELLNGAQRARRAET